jgi:uncharacterized protein (DUF2267 family)
MSAQGLEVIDHTVQLTHQWINKLKERLGWESSRDSLRLLRMTLRQVRDHLGHDEMAQLSAQMPLLVRGMFFEGWSPSHTPVHERSLEAFMEPIEAKLADVEGWRGAPDVTAVFETLNEKISAGEIGDVRAGLPQSIRDLWPV